MDAPRTAPAAADRDDRGRQLDARPRGGAVARRRRRRRTRSHADACFVYLYDERADELVLRATHGTRVEEMTQRPRMRPGEGITGSAAESRAPVTIAAQAHLDPRFKNFPNLPEDEYESILAVPILARGERLEGALNVRTRDAARVHRATRSSCCSRSRRRWRSRSSTRSSTPRRSGACTSSRRSRGSPRRSRSRSTWRSRSRRS